MTFQTILVHVDDSEHAAARIRLASAVALRCDAHLSGIAPSGVSRFLYQSVPSEADDPTLALHLEFVRAQARRALEAFEAQCASAGVPAWDARLVDDEPGAGLSLHARSADLLVISQPAAEARAVAADLPPYVITHSGRPVLLAPVAGLPEHHGHVSCGRSVLVAWDGRREAARALQVALPLLRQAETVQLVVFDVASDEHLARDALLADPRPWLARHGVQASLTVDRVVRARGPRRGHELGEALLGHAAGNHADMLVMGAYGHSRFRETILGGVTRTVMEAMHLPVLMVH